MISSVGEFWFLALGFPIIIFVLLVFLLATVESIPLIGIYLTDDKQELSKAKKQSSFLYYLLMPLREALLPLTLILPIFFSYLVFTDGYSVTWVKKENAANSSKLVLDNGFIFKPTALAGLTPFLTMIGMGEDLDNYLSPKPAKILVRYTFTQPKLTDAFEMSFKDSPHSAKLIINATDQMLYYYQHFYTFSDVEAIDDHLIPAKSILATRQGFFVDPYLGCDAEIPETFSSDITVKAQDSFVLQITPVAKEDC